MRSDRPPFLLTLSAIGGLLFLHLPILLIFLYAFTTEEKSYQFPPPGLTTDAVQPQHPLNLNFGDQITLLGFDADIERLVLYWQAQTIVSIDYTVFVHLVDSASQTIRQFDSPPAGGSYPTSLWDPGEIIVDERRLSDLPTGRYNLLIGLYDPVNSQRLPVAGSAEGAVKLMEFEVK